MRLRHVILSLFPLCIKKKKNIQGVLAKLAISPEWIAQQCSIYSGRHLFAKLNELFIFLFNCYNSIDVIACNRRQRALLTRL